ncbi:MAG: hypothetical protein QW290_07080 [Sulfolobales archaeon]
MVINIVDFTQATLARSDIRKYKNASASNDVFNLMKILETRGFVLSGEDAQRKDLIVAKDEARGLPGRLAL